MNRIIDVTYIDDQKISASIGEMTNNATRPRTLTWLVRWSGLSLESRRLRWKLISGLQARNQDRYRLRDRYA